VCVSSHVQIPSQFADVLNFLLWDLKYYDGGTVAVKVWCVLDGGIFMYFRYGCDYLIVIY
jgi:hypothetical protein